MKKLSFSLMTFAVATAAMAQTKGRFEVYNFDNFKIHVYYTNDVMGDASYIIEGPKALITMEHPLFKENVTEFDAYVEKLGKPVGQRIADYHVGGTSSEPYAMAEGMPEFSKGSIYGGMMQGFAQSFGDAMGDLPTGKTSEVAFGKTETYDGIPFTFMRGASTDFPAASIIIGKKAYYTHWTPAKAHVSHLQVSSPAAIDAEIAEARKALASGCELFLGGHGGAAKADAVEFKISYLERMKRILSENKTPEDFVAAMKKAFPGLPGEVGLEDLAKALYK